MVDVFCAGLGEDEPLVSRVTETDIAVLKKDSLIISTVSDLIDTNEPRGALVIISAK